MASPPMTDFGNSYVMWTIPADPTDTRQPGHQPWGNSARIQIDARCTIIDAETGQAAAFFLIAPCRNEWMYNERDLIQRPGGEYRVIFSADRQRFVGKALTERGPRVASGPTDVFTDLAFVLNHHPNATRLETEADIIAATLAFRPLTCSTEIRQEHGQLSAILEYPIRTMNIHPERGRFQVDTGPLIYPDLASLAAPWIEHLNLAHTVFNRLDQAEFVVKQPTPLDPADPFGPAIYDYSRFVAHDVTHTFTAAVSP